jgi:hypothetical protein
MEDVLAVYTELFICVLGKVLNRLDKVGFVVVAY